MGAREVGTAQGYNHGGDSRTTAVPRGVGQGPPLRRLKGWGGRATRGVDSSQPRPFERAWSAKGCKFRYWMEPV